MKEYRSIIWRNFATPVVIAVYSLALILLLLGSTRDAYFVSFVITLNFILAVVQEIRARRALKKLELMSAPRARRVLPDGSTEDVMYTDLGVDDTILLSAGDEVPADATLLESKGMEVDESMLTGESAAVEKDRDGTIFASSTVVAGSGKAVVTAVGADSRAGEMTAKLKQYVPEQTPVLKKINLTISVLTYGALVVSVIVGVSYALMGHSLVQIFTTITSGAVSIIPEGLLLASTLLLAFGSLKLALIQVLPQKISAIEAMALLNVLCVDKTGTLTEPEVVFEDFHAFHDADDSRLYKQLVALVAQETSGGNATGDAIIAGLKKPDESRYHVENVLAFSSERKLSAATITLDSETYHVFMGAPEFVNKVTPLTDAQMQLVKDLSSEGKRVLLIGEFKNSSDDLKSLANRNDGRAIGLIVLANNLREGVKDTVSFLQNRGVSVRVISGDNPATVRYIAEQAGIVNPERAITGAELAELSDAEWKKTVYRTTIFARVLPEQKERIIATLKGYGKFTGMVGDGVNDALALKKADLGVAMQSGAAATRRVADLVLLNNSFTALPPGMILGNRIVQAIELIATLFFHKIIYSLLLLFLTMVLTIKYPFLPRHVTFMNMFLVTAPTIMWTLFPPTPKRMINPLHFWKETLFAILPISILTGLTVTGSYWYLTSLAPDDPSGVATTVVIIATFFGINTVFLVSTMLHVAYDRMAKIARGLYVLAVVALAGVTFGFGFTREFFDFTRPATNHFLPLLLIIIGVVTLQWHLARRAGKHIAREVADTNPSPND